MKQVKRVLSWVLALCMMVGALPSGVLAQAIDLADAGRYDIMKDSLITKEGKALSVSDVIALIEGGADLSEAITVDGTSMTLGEFKTMVELELELMRIDETYFNHPYTLTDAHQASLASLSEQLQTRGLGIKSAGIDFPSGVDHNTTLTMSLEAGPPLKNEAGSVRVVFTLDRAAKSPVTFTVHTADASAAGGVNYTAVSGESLTIPAEQSSTYLDIAILQAADWAGEKVFFIQLSGLAGALVNGAQSASLPVVITGGKTYLMEFERTAQSNDSGDNAVPGLSDFELAAFSAAEQQSMDSGIITKVEFSPVNYQNLTFSGDEITVRRLTASLGSIQYETRGDCISSMPDEGGEYEKDFSETGALVQTFNYTPSIGRTGNMFRREKVCRATGVGYVDDQEQYAPQTMKLRFFDGTAPTVTGAAAASGTYGKGSVVPVTVTFSEPVEPNEAYIMVSGTRLQAVESAASQTLTFPFVVGPTTPKALKVTGIYGIKDITGNIMTNNEEVRSISGPTIEDASVGDAARMSTLAPSKLSFDPEETEAELTLTLPLEEALSTLLKGYEQDDNGDSYCKELFASIDGGQNLIRFYPVGQQVTEFKASIPLGPAGGQQAYAVELYDKGGNLLFGRYAAFTRAEPVKLTEDDFSIVAPGSFPQNAVYIDALPPSSALKLGIKVEAGAFTWADTGKVTAYISEGVLPPGDFHFAWKSSAPNVASIDKNGQITINAPGKAEFSLIALNGGQGAVSCLKTVPLEILSGNTPILTMSLSGQRIEAREKEVVTVRWSTNIHELNDQADAGHVTPFTVAVYETDGAGEATGVAIREKTVQSSLASPITSVTFEGLDTVSVGDVPSYIAVVSASTIAGVPGGVKEYTAKASICIRAQPAVVRLTRPESLYITDAKGVIDIPWSVINFDAQNPAEFSLTVTDNRTGLPVIPPYTDIQTTPNPLSLSIPSVAAGEFRDIYTVEVSAKNQLDPTWSHDSFVLYVYADDALKIFVEGAAPAGGKATLSNHDWIKGLPDQAAILALSRDITLEKAVSINYGEHAWSEIADRIEWAVSDPDVASLNTKQGGFYYRIEDQPYTSYAPVKDFKLAGLQDGEATVSATHAILGSALSTSIDVTVETLKDSLYLFSFYPAAETTITYNGKTVKSDANGQAAIYEENGITGKIHLSSESGGEAYFGTLDAAALRSGEQSPDSLELYPVNHFTLREAATVPLRFVQADGSPLAGSIAVRGGVYRNGEYCMDAIIDNNPDEEVGVTKDYVVALDSQGNHTFRFNINNFKTLSEQSEVTAEDEITFVFEVRREGYYPLLMSVDGNMDTRTVIRTGTRVAALEVMPNAMKGQPFVAAQTAYYSNKAEGSGLSVRGSKGKIGPSGATPELTLSTVVVWPGAEAGSTSPYKVEITDNGSRVAPAQKSQAKSYPFSTLTVVENIFHLNDTSLKAWGLTSAMQSYNLTLRYSSAGTVVKNERTSLQVVNMTGFDPAATGDIDTLVNDLQGVIMGSSSSGMPFGDGMIGTGLKLLTAVKVDTPILKFKLAPTPDPTVFKAIFFIGVDKINSESDLSYMPGLTEVKGVVKEGSQYGSTAAKEVTDAFEKLKNNKAGKSGNATAGDGSVMFALTGYIEAEVFYDYDALRWECDFLNGSFTAGGGYGYEWYFNSWVGPIPVTAELGVGASAQVNVGVASDKIAGGNDVMTTLRVQAYFRAFGGIGFDYAVIALKIGLYGQLDADLQFRWLSAKFSDVEYTYNIGLSGTVGVKFKAKMLFISYETTLWSESFEANLLKKKNWDNVEWYWKSVAAGRSGNQYSPLSTSSAHLLAYDAMTQTAIYQSPSRATVESRDYLEQYTRSWNSGASAGMRALRGANEPLKLLQENAYPYSDPKLSDDGELMLYLSDQSRDEVTKTRVAYTRHDGSTYPEGTLIDDDGFGDSQLSLSGTKDFAVAAWTRMREDMVKKAPGSEITHDEQAMMLDSTEIMAAIYDGTDWVSVPLTDNSSADMAPVAVTNGDKAIVLWRSVSSSNSGDLLNFDAKDRIYYRVYDQGTKEWSQEVETLYNGTSGAVKAIDAVMSKGGSTAVTYTIKAGTDSTDTSDLDIVYAIIDEQGQPQRNVRLTNDTFTNENPRLAAVRMNGEPDDSFILAWHSIQNNDGVEKHDIRLAAFDEEGNLNPGFVDSLCDLIMDAGTNLTADFGFSKNAETLSELSLIWREPALDYAEDISTERDVLTAIRFEEGAGGAVSVTAAQHLASMPAGTTADSFDVYVGSGGSLKGVVLGTTYGLGDAAHVGTTGGGTAIYVASERSDLYTAALSYTDEIRVDSVLPDFQAIRRGGVVPIQFGVTNLGTEAVEKLEVKIGAQTVTLEGAQLPPIAPGENRTVIVSYTVPDLDKITDPEYTVKAYFKSAGKTSSKTGEVYLDVPDLGISTLAVKNAYDGERHILLGAYNDSDSALYQSQRTVGIRLYTDAECTNPLDERYYTPVTVKSDEQQLIDRATYTAQTVFDVASYVKAAENKDYLDEGEIRESGITLYAKIAAFEPALGRASLTPEVSEYLGQNNVQAITIGSLITAAGGEKTSVTTAMNTTESGTELTASLQNNSLRGMLVEGITAVLFDAEGNEIERKPYTGGQLVLGGEQKAELSFSFTKKGASATIEYTTTALENDVAELSSVTVGGTSVAMDSFTYDPVRQVYAASVTVSGLSSATVTASAKAVNGTVAIDGGAFTGSTASKQVSLTPGGKTTVTIQSKSGDGSVTYTYELVIESSGGSGSSPGAGGSTPAITPKAASYEQKGGGTLSVKLESGGKTLSGITSGGKALTKGTDYTVSGGSYTFTESFLSALAAGEHKIIFTLSGGVELTFTLTVTDQGQSTWQNPFTDVRATDWFYPDVAYAHTNGLFEGTSATTFSPGSPMSRAMLVTVLWRVAGAPTQSGASPFSDVPKGQWFTQAVAWASENQIVSGYGGGAFGPGDQVTREQFATILHRYAMHTGIDVSVGEDTNILSYTDAFSISEYAVSAMQWACGAGIIGGRTDGSLDPKGFASRAEAAAMLHRFMTLHQR